MTRPLALAALGRLRPVASLVVITSLLLPIVPATAFADGSMGQDEVTLKDGGTVRGTVVSSRPGVGVKIIELGQTEARMIPWAEVGDVERGKFTAKKKAAVQPGSAGPGYGQTVPPAPPPPPAPPAGSQVRLHVQSPVPAMLFSHQTAYGAVNGYGFVVDAATPVCSSPCDKVFDSESGQTYTAGGEFNSSPAFSLAGTKGDVELSIEPGSRGLRGGGLALIWVGGLALITGASFLLTGALLSSDTTTTVNEDGTTSTSDSGTGWLTPAGLAIGGGGIAMIVGGVIMLVESKTKIDLHPMGGVVSGQTAAAKPRYWMGEF